MNELAKQSQLEGPNYSQLVDLKDSESEEHLPTKVIKEELKSPNGSEDTRHQSKWRSFFSSQWKKQYQASHFRFKLILGVGTIACFGALSYIVALFYKKLLSQ